MDHYFSQFKNIGIISLFKGVFEQSGRFFDKFVGTGHTIMALLTVEHLNLTAGEIQGD